MAQKLLIGTDTFGPDGWSGAGYAASAELEVSVRFPRITGGLDQSTIGGIKSLDINAGASGTIGGPDDGPLIMDADDGAGGDSRVRNVGKVDLFIQAGGPNALIENIHTGNPAARTRMLGGTFGVNSISAGKVTASGSTTITDYYALGGKSKLLYGASGGAITKLTQSGGGVLLNRKANEIIVGAGAILDLDPDSAVSQAGVTIKIYGGLVRWWGGELPSIEAIGGVIDFRVARGSIGDGLGATKFDVAGTQIFANPDVDLSNLSDLGAVFRTDSGMVQSGGSQPSP